MDVRKGKESEVTHSCPTLCDPMDRNLPGSSVHGIFQARVLQEYCNGFLLQGIFLTQGLNPGLPHCRQTLYHLSHQGSPSVIRVVSFPYLRLLTFFPAILAPACASSSLAFHMMYSAYKLNKQSDNIQP